MKALKIYKMTGAGNDFVVVDNRRGTVTRKEIGDLARRICARRVSVGADGLLLIESSDTADFKMRVINPDGSEPEMCGNGSRCACFLAHELGIASEKMTFETMAGTMTGEIKGNVVGIKLQDVNEMHRLSLECESGSFDVTSVNTGVPHAVVIVDDLENQDVVGVGHAIRYHENFQPDGTNVDFVGRSSGSEISIRTYERGVEDETLSCGTGSVASALVHSGISGADSPITVTARSGETLSISFIRNGEKFTDVIMEGPVRKVFEGTYIP